MSTDNNGSAYANLPKWVRVIGVIGFPSAVAAYLLWVFVGGLPTKVEALQKDVSVHIIHAEQHSTEFKAFLTDHQQEINAILQVLQQQCVLQAVAVGRDTNACFPAKTQAPGK